MKYFDDIELSQGHDEDQICLKYMKLFKNNGKPQVPVYNSSDSFALIFVCILKMQQTWFLSHTLDFILPNKDEFWFLLMLKDSAAEICKKNKT